VKNHKASLLNGEIHPAAVTLPELLKSHGYKTHIAGKWHLGGKKFPSPLDRGFDHFYGILGGASSFFAPYKLTRDRKLITDEYKKPDYYFTNAVSDTAVNWIKKADKETPLFLYVAYTAAHWPLHAFEKDIEPYKGKFAKGWDKLREERFKRMQELDVLPPNASLSPIHPDVKSWDNVENKSWEQRRMEVYAAQLTVMDEGVGRIVSALKEKGRFDNSLIFFNIDNGGCHVEFSSKRKGAFLPKKTRAGGKMIPGNIPEVMPGPENTYQSYGMNWANLSNTPYQYFKKYDHEGGIRTPMIVHWPAKIKARGKLIRSPAHLVDIMPTLLEISGISLPEKSYGKTRMELDGVSFKAELLDEGNSKKRKSIFFHHAVGRALRTGNWKIVSKDKRVWELYNLAQDPVELKDLSATNSEKLQEMVAEWEKISKEMIRKNKK
jgi:arylsulfatase A-like enzyme